jgi:hypothetical protein
MIGLAGERAVWLWFWLFDLFFGDDIGGNLHVFLQAEWEEEA